MQLSLKLDIKPLEKPINYQDKILLTGSCFTEHISDRLQQHKFNTLCNPNGILFNPLSVAGSLNSYINGESYTISQLFCLNELWNSWNHHTRFSDIDPHAALNKINSSQTAGSSFIKEAKWVIITLGSAFQYYLLANGMPVANNHRAPAQWFEKKLLPVNEIIDALSGMLQLLFTTNDKVQVLFTISPVRHIRDGVIENNRSKARLIEAVHELCVIFKKVYYFPAYELLIDILRDYRFYDIDFVHPNFLATSYIWEQFVNSCIHIDNQPIMEQVIDIMTAAAHRPLFPGTDAHARFLQNYARKTALLMEQYPFLDLHKELLLFRGN